MIRKIDKSLESFELSLKRSQVGRTVFFEFFHHTHIMLIILFLRPGKDMESDFIPVFSVKLQSFHKLFFFLLCPGLRLAPVSDLTSFDNFLDTRINFQMVLPDIRNSFIYLSDCSCRDHFVDLVFVYTVHLYRFFEQKMLFY